MRNPIIASTPIGMRCSQLDGVYAQPGGTSGPPIMPAMLMPGIIGISTDSAISKAPTSVPLAYASGNGVQNTSGANSSHTPTKALAHCAQGWRRHALADNMLKAITRTPLSTSLQLISRLRSSNDDSPRSAITRSWLASGAKLLM
jgi:hypothetical protein